MGAGGHPRTQKFLSQPCAVPPSTVTHLDHTIVVITRSPVPVASSSLSPRHHADRTHPHPQLDQEHKGRHRDERVMTRRCRTFGTWISWIAKTFDYINRVTKRFHFWYMRVHGHTLSSRCYASHR